MALEFATLIGYRGSSDDAILFETRKMAARARESRLDLVEFVRKLGNLALRQVKRASERVALTAVLGNPLADGFDTASNLVEANLRLLGILGNFARAHAHRQQSRQKKASEEGAFE